MELIGEKIRGIRKSKGISQTTVSDTCGIKQSSYANIENGKTQNITIEIGKGISNALGIPFNELFEIEAPVSTSFQIENQLEEKNAKIVELQKQIEQKDLLIDMLRKENQELLEAEAWFSVDQLFDYLTEDEVKLREATTDEEKNKLKSDIDYDIEALKDEIETHLEKKIISKEKLLQLFFDGKSFAVLMQNDSKTKDDFIKNSTNYINQFLQIEVEYVEKYVRMNFTTKWDNPKLWKKRARN